MVEGAQVSWFDFAPTLPQLPQANCRDIADPDLFFPESTEERKSLRIVREICGGCIVRKECLDFALKEQIPHGIWAGFTWEQRKQMIVNRTSKGHYGSRARKIREMASEGVDPKEIAKALQCEPWYVNQVLNLAEARLKGKLQSQPKEKSDPQKPESPSSSGFPQ